MSKLAAYLPSMEEQYAPDIHDDATEFTQHDVTVAGVAVGQALADHDTTGEIIATLESILDDIEAVDRLTPMDRVFIGHSIQSVQRRTGLVVRTPSMEANDEDGRQISMEGIAQGLAKLWEGMVELIRKILRGIKDFFAMLFGFGKRKEKRIKFQLAKAKEGGNDASISKLAEKNLLKHLEDVSSVQRVLDKLVATPLEKERPEQLVLLTPAAAQIVVRESDHPVDSSHPMTVGGQDIVAMRRKDVKAVEHMSLGKVKHALMTAMAANGRRRFLSTEDSSVLMSHEDVNEMVWDTAFRGKEARARGKDLASLLMKIAVKAEKAFTSVDAMSRHKQDFTKEIAEATRSERESIYKIFREFVGKDDLAPLGNNLLRVGRHEASRLSISDWVHIPVVGDSVGKTIKIKFPEYGEVKKAADGIVTVTLLSNFNGSIDAALKGFEDVLKVYERLQAWAITNAKGDQITQRQISACTREMYDLPVKFFSSYIRAVGIMETIVIEWGDSISNPLSKLADSKRMMAELA